tara:strand:- start:5356 stop:5535 length:180 start_codon:yes stop_codon:yes gene_type:complete
VRATEKQVREAIQKKDASAATQALRAFSSGIDKAASKGVFHARTAARKVSRLASQIAKI